MSAETKEKKPRAARRNFDKLREDTLQYCRIKVDVLRSIDKSGTDPLWQSNIEAYEDVIARLEGK